MCTCLSIIDWLGDHLLGSPVYPLSQCTSIIVHHALLQDHPGVLQEQDIPSFDCSRPGDVNHPHFHLGRLLIFFLSDVPPSLLLFPLLLFRLGWLLLPVRRLKTIIIYAGSVNSQGGDFLVCEALKLGLRLH